MMVSHCQCAARRAQPPAVRRCAGSSKAQSMVRAFSNCQMQHFSNTEVHIVHIYRAINLRVSKPYVTN